MNQTHFQSKGWIFMFQSAKREQEKRLTSLSSSLTLWFSCFTLALSLSNSAVISLFFLASSTILVAATSPANPDTPAKNTWKQRAHLAGQDSEWMMLLFPVTMDFHCPIPSSQSCARHFNEQVEGRDVRGASWMGWSFDSATFPTVATATCHKATTVVVAALLPREGRGVSCSLLGTEFFGITTEKGNTLLCLVVYYWRSC